MACKKLPPSLSGSADTPEFGKSKLFQICSKKKVTIGPYLKSVIRIIVFASVPLSVDMFGRVDLPGILIIMFPPNGNVRLRRICYVEIGDSPPIRPDRRSRLEKLGESPIVLAR